MQACLHSDKKMGRKNGDLKKQKRHSKYAPKGLSSFFQVRISTRCSMDKHKKTKKCRLFVKKHPNIFKTISQLFA